MRKAILCGVLALVCLLGGFRIFQVNTSDFIDLFPQRQYFSTGEPVPLEQGHYYFTSYDWTGYTVEVTGSTVVSTDDFLKEHNAPENFLEDLNLRDDLHHKNQFLLLVHTFQVSLDYIIFGQSMEPRLKELKSELQNMISTLKAIEKTL